jgi:hypothetical protein
LSQVKLNGLYPLPWWGVQVSAVLQNLAGAAITANYPARSSEVAASLGRPLAAGQNAVVLVPLIAPQTMFGERLTQVDLRVAKSLRRGNTRVLAALDIYNVLNTATVLSVVSTYGPNWLRPSGVVGGRLFKVSAQITY